MEIEIRDLMDSNELLSHIFLGCIPREQLIEIKEKYMSDEKDWRKESVTIPVEMTIGGISVNPKQFFDTMKSQMVDMIGKKANEIVAQQYLIGKINDIQDKLNEYHDIISSWQTDINWDIKNPFDEDVK